MLRRSVNAGLARGHLKVAAYIPVVASLGDAD